jgi:hypothetical protein
MSWCREHLESGCIFGEEPPLQATLCPEADGGECTLVRVMLALDRAPESVRRRLIPALFAAYRGEPAPESARAPGPAARGGASTGGGAARRHAAPLRQGEKSRRRAAQTLCNLD